MEQRTLPAGAGEIYMAEAFVHATLKKEGLKLDR